MLACHREANSHTSWGRRASSLPEPLAWAEASSVSLFCRITASEGGNRLVEKLLFTEEPTSSRMEHLEKTLHELASKCEAGTSKEGQNLSVCHSCNNPVKCETYWIGEFWLCFWKEGRKRDILLCFCCICIFPNRRSNPLIYDHFSSLECHMPISGSFLSALLMCSVWTSQLAISFTNGENT